VDEVQNHFYLLNLHFQQIDVMLRYDHVRKKWVEYFDYLKLEQVLNWKDGCNLLKLVVDDKVDGYLGMEAQYLKDLMKQMHLYQSKRLVDRDEGESCEGDGWGSEGWSERGSLSSVAMFHSD